MDYYDKLNLFLDEEFLQISKKSNKDTIIKKIKKDNGFELSVTCKNKSSNCDKNIKLVIPFYINLSTEINELHYNLNKMTIDNLNTEPLESAIQELEMLFNKFNNIYEKEQVISELSKQRITLLEEKNKYKHMIFNESDLSLKRAYILKYIEYNKQLTKVISSMNQYNYSISNIVRTKMDVQHELKEEVKESTLELKPLIESGFNIGDIVSWTDKSGEHRGVIQKLKPKIVSVKEESTGTLKNIPKGKVTLVKVISKDKMVQDKADIAEIEKLNIGNIVSWTDKSGEHRGVIEKLKPKIVSVKEELTGTLKNIPKGKVTLVNEGKDVKSIKITLSPRVDDSNI